jgi:hypothetical protein
MRHVVTTVLVLVALVHLLPLAGALGPARLVALYGVPVADPNLEVLLRHRAVLFGILGGWILAGALHAPLTTSALLAGLASVASFLVLAAIVGPVNAPLQRVVAVDIVALLLLLAAAGVHVWRGAGR